MSASSQRDQVWRVATSDIHAALRLASSIPDPWYRCQALACVAWNADDHERFLAHVARSLESSRAIVIPNRSVTVAAWPVAALAKRSFGERHKMTVNAAEISRVVPRLVETISAEPNPASRGDALLMLVHALSPDPPG